VSARTAPGRSLRSGKDRVRNLLSRRSAGKARMSCARFFSRARPDRYGHEGRALRTALSGAGGSYVLIATQVETGFLSSLGQGRNAPAVLDVGPATLDRLFKKQFQVGEDLVLVRIRQGSRRGSIRMPKASSRSGSKRGRTET
jgi:hypothetical protein